MGARGFPAETQCFECVLSREWCFLAGFGEWTVRWTSRVLWMAVVSQSSENSSRQENRELPRREQHTRKEQACKSMIAHQRCTSAVELILSNVNRQMALEFR